VVCTKGSKQLPEHLYVIHRGGERASRNADYRSVASAFSSAAISMQLCRNKTLIPKNKISQKIPVKFYTRDRRRWRYYRHGKKRLAYADRAQSAAGVSGEPAGADFATDSHDQLCAWTRIKQRRRSHRREWRSHDAIFRAVGFWYWCKWSGVT